MSKGPGRIEQRIADLFAATRDRALSIDEITDNTYGLGGRKPTREQRLSATRAAHRLLRRVREMRERARRLHDKARADLKAANVSGPEYRERLEVHPLWLKADALFDEAHRVGTWGRIVPGDRRGDRKIETDFWCTATLKGRLWFHPPGVPVRVWTITIDSSGVHWFDAEVIKVTYRNVMVRYRGEAARLDRRQLWYWWAFWRGVRFVSSRSGRIAAALDEVWQESYGHAAGGVPPSMQMPLAEAIELLGVPSDYSRDNVIAAFRRKAKQAHPDVGGTAEMFRKLVEARDRLLAAIGTSAPAPKMPTYAPKGVTVAYRVGRSNSTSRRLGGSSTKLLT